MEIGLEKKPQLDTVGLIAQVSFFALAKAAPNLLTYSHWLTSGTGIAIGFFMSSQIGDAVASSWAGRSAAVLLVSALVYAATFYWKILPILPMVESRDEGNRIAKAYEISDGSWKELSRFTVANSPVDVRCTFGKAILSQDRLDFVRKIAKQMRLARRLLLSQLACTVAGVGLLALAKLDVLYQ
ncbi:hypothetical protein ACFJIW_20215 [Tahibacter sp. UC22_41]|uniref:hypothetical protein n=1 Tax=Tahibacter sp. UC22_41 TaxID=3350178 RepID=UPI0036DD2F58